MFKKPIKLILIYHLSDTFVQNVGGTMKNKGYMKKKGKERKVHKKRYARK